MRPIHWAIVWISAMLLAIGLLSPSALEAFAERMALAFHHIAVVGITFGILYLGFRLIVSGKK